MSTRPKHRAVVTDSLQMREAADAIQAARVALERLAALSGADSHVSVRLSMPWESGDEPTLRIEIATVRERVNRCQRVLDIRKWSGPTAEAIAEQLYTAKCVCDDCEARRHAEELYAFQAARPPVVIFEPREPAAGNEEPADDEEPSPMAALVDAYLERQRANDH